MLADKSPWKPLYSSSAGCDVLVLTYYSPRFQKPAWLLFKTGGLGKLGVRSVGQSVPFAPTSYHWEPKDKDLIPLVNPMLNLDIRDESPRDFEFFRRFLLLELWKKTKNNQQNYLSRMLSKNLMYDFRVPAKQHKNEHSGKTNELRTFNLISLSVLNSQTLCCENNGQRRN